MSVKQFEELIAWQKAQDLAVEIYKQFSENKDFGFKNQICTVLFPYQITLLKDLTEALTLTFQGFFIFRLVLVVK